jgi:hypothetical protein
MKKLLIALASLCISSAWATSAPIGKVYENQRTGERIGAVCITTAFDGRCAEVALVETAKDRPEETKTLFRAAAFSKVAELEARMKSNNEKPDPALLITSDGEDFLLAIILFPPSALLIPVIIVGEVVSYPVRAAVRVTQRLHVQHRVNVGNRALDSLFNGSKAGVIDTVGNHRYKLIRKAIASLQYPGAVH